MFLFAFNALTSCVLAFGTWWNMNVRHRLSRRMTFDDLFIMINTYMFIMNAACFVLVHFGFKTAAAVVFVGMFTPLVLLSTYGFGEALMHVSKIKNIA
jgi:hypothetical protein